MPQTLTLIFLGTSQGEYVLWDRNQNKNEKVKKTTAVSGLDKSFSVREEADQFNMRRDEKKWKHL